MRKKAISVAIAVTALLVPVVAGTVTADSIPATKTAAVMTDLELIDGTVGFEHIEDLDLSIKTGTPKDLVICVSLESTLYTTNKVTKAKDFDASEAGVAVMVKLVKDGVATDIGNPVVFNRRLVELRAEIPTEVDEDYLIELFMETKSANSFSFIVENVGSNVSSIQVWMNSSQYDEGPPKVGAIVGNASVVVNEVNLK